jgi:hypothetical protein
VEATLAEDRVGAPQLEASIAVELGLPPEVLSTCGQLGVDAATMSAMKPATRQNTPVVAAISRALAGFVSDLARMTPRGDSKTQ